MGSKREKKNVWGAKDTGFSILVPKIIFCSENLPKLGDGVPLTYT
jgi:hypothetical protein